MSTFSVCSNWILKQKLWSAFILWVVTEAFRKLFKERRNYIAPDNIAAAAGPQWNMVEEERIYSMARLQLKSGAEIWMSIKRILPQNDWGEGMFCSCTHFLFEEVFPIHLLFSHLTACHDLKILSMGKPQNLHVILVKFSENSSFSIK